MSAERRSPPGADLVAETAPLEPGAAARLALHFLDEPERDPVPIDRELRLGRDAACEVCLPDESVSRLHAVVEATTPPRVRDHDSRNGTFVGGAEVARGTSVALTAGATLRIGSVLMLVDAERTRRRRTDSDADGNAPLRAAVGPMAEVFALADRLARDDINILLTGETGVGKEVVAHYLHAHSARASGPFVPVHAAALAASLFESELFGHDRGAFTGAVGERPGLFELAAGGTLFFDEIGELPLDVQPKLLRVLEDHRVTRVGGRTARTVDVRIVAATNRDLASEAARGTFRSDLYFRLNGFPILIPPLRERREELPVLAADLVRRVARERGREPPALGPATVRRLLAHAWPGNVRELRATLTRALLLNPPGAKILDDAALDRAIGPDRPASARPDEEDGDRNRIIEALAKHGGNQAAAAAELGMARRTLLYKLDKLGLPRPRKGRARS